MSISGRQPHRGKSQSPAAWVASLEETNAMKPTDKAILGMVSKSPGRNASEPTGGLENLSPGGRAPFARAKAAWPGAKLTGAPGHSGGVVGTAR